MTVIAYCARTRTMAADSRITFGDFDLDGPKLFRLDDDSIVGLAGESAQCGRLLAFLRGEIERPEETEAQAIHVDMDGVVTLYSYNAWGEVITSPFVCIGSGGTIAHTALSCGYTLEQAIEKACEISHQCGGPVQVMRLDGPVNG